MSTEKEPTRLEFKLFPKIARLNRECIITEKIDGTNACVIITEAERDEWKLSAEMYYEQAIALTAENERLRAALEAYAVCTDELSWHGEALVCKLCGGRGTRAGAKRGVGDKPVEHADTCMLFRAALAPRKEPSGN